MTCIQYILSNILIIIWKLLVISYYYTIVYYQQFYQQGSLDMETKGDKLCQLKY